MPRHLGHPVRRDVELEAGLDDRGGDRIVAAAGAQRGHAALVVAAGQAELVARRPRVGDLRLGDEGHAASPCASQPADTPDHVVGADRHAVVVQDRMQLLRTRSALADEQLAQLGVAVLLDDEDLLVRVRGTLGTSVAERERRAGAGSRRCGALGRQQLQRLAHGAVAAAEGDHDQARVCARAGVAIAAGTSAGRGVELAQQAIDQSPGTRRRPRCSAPLGLWPEPRVK